jgi:cell wall-associated NlpC family hydrolase
LIFLAATARGRVAVAITCSVIAAMLSFSAATAEDEIPAGSGSVALSQDAAQDAPLAEGVAPATADATVTDPPAADSAGVPTPTDEWVEPAATDAATDTGSTAPLTDAAGSVDQATDTWTDPAPVDSASADPEADSATGEVIAPATGQAVAPAPVEAGPDGLAPPIEAAPVEPSLPSGPEPPGQPIATAYVAGTGGDGAPCLTAPQWGAETLAVLAEGQPVEVRAETMGEWQPVNCAGAGGYVHVALIAWTPVGSPDPATAGGDQPEGKTGGGGDAVGEQIVRFALQFQGYPYIYAGEGPYAFDCSGFTMFVIHNTLGINIPHDMFVQYQLGRPVSRDELQPGDLVFFQNTFRPGMSHDGIYIGGGQFIHAETESSGVRISDLDSDYYSSRWYGAVRFA